MAGKKYVAPLVASLVFLATFSTAVALAPRWFAVLLAIAWLLFLHLAGHRLPAGTYRRLERLASRIDGWFLKSAAAAVTVAAAILIVWGLAATGQRGAAIALGTAFGGGAVVFIAMMRLNPSLWYRHTFLVVLLLWTQAGLGGLSASVSAVFGADSLVARFSSETGPLSDFLFGAILAALLLLDFAQRSGGSQPATPSPTPSRALGGISVAALALIAVACAYVPIRDAYGPFATYWLAAIAVFALAPALYRWRFRRVPRGGTYHQWGWVFPDSQPSEVLVVFVHGILSGPRTWFETVEALKRGGPVGAEMLLYKYAAFPFLQGSTEDAAKQLRAAIEERESNGPRFRHVIFVGHSHGGLVVKKLLAEEGETLLSQLDNSDAYVHSASLCHRTRTLVHVAVPHRGGHEWLDALGRTLGRVNRRLIPLLRRLDRLTGGNAALGYNTIFESLSSRNTDLAVSDSAVDSLRQQFFLAGLPFARIIDVIPTHDVIANVGDEVVQDPCRPWRQTRLVRGPHQLSRLEPASIERTVRYALAHIDGAFGVLQDRVIGLNLRRERREQVAGLTWSQGIACVGIIRQVHGLTQSRCRLAIVGAAGMGKSRAIAHAGRRLAARYLSTHNSVVPIIFQLQHLDIEVGSSEESVAVETLLRKLLDQWCADVNRLTGTAPVISPEWILSTVASQRCVLLIDGIDNFLSKHPSVPWETLHAAILQLAGASAFLVLGIRRGTRPERSLVPSQWDVLELRPMRVEEVAARVPALERHLFQLQSMYARSNNWSRISTLLRTPLIIFALRRDLDLVARITQAEPHAKTRRAGLTQTLDLAMSSIVESAAHGIAADRLLPAATPEYGPRRADLLALIRATRARSGTEITPTGAARELSNPDSGGSLLPTNLSADTVRHLDRINAQFYEGLVCIAVCYYADLRAALSESELRDRLADLAGRWASFAQAAPTPSVANRFVASATAISEDIVSALSSGLFETHDDVFAGGNARWSFSHAQWHDFLIAKYICSCVEGRFLGEFGRYGFYPSMMEMTGEMIDDHALDENLVRESIRSGNLILLCNTLALMSWRPDSFRAGESIRLFMDCVVSASAGPSHVPPFVRTFVMNGICHRVLGSLTDEAQRYEPHNASWLPLIRDHLGSIVADTARGEEDPATLSQAWMYLSSLGCCVSEDPPVRWSASMLPRLAPFVCDVPGTARHTLQLALCALVLDVFLQNKEARWIAALHYLLFLCVAYRQHCFFSETLDTLRVVFAQGSTHRAFFKSRGSAACSLFIFCEELWRGEVRHA